MTITNRLRFLRVLVFHASAIALGFLLGMQVTQAALQLLT